MHPQSQIDTCHHFIIGLNALFVSIKSSNRGQRWLITTADHAVPMFFITGQRHSAITKHCYYPICITLHPPTKMNNGRKTKPRTVSSIANGTSHMILARSHTQPNNICDMCVQGRGNKAISEVIWAESVMVQWQCVVLVVRKGKNSEASKLEWKNDKWQAT